MTWVEAVGVEMAVKRQAVGRDKETDWPTAGAHVRSIIAHPVTAVWIAI